MSENELFDFLAGRGIADAALSVNEQGEILALGARRGTLVRLLEYGVPGGVRQPKGAAAGIVLAASQCRSFPSGSCG